MRLKLIACEILFREINFVVKNSPHEVEVEFLAKGLHDLGKEGMFGKLFEAVNGFEVDGYDAILLGYGLCSGGVVGLRAGRVPIIIPRAHDCITLFMGDRWRYLEYFSANNGVYFQTTGWIERGGELTQKLPDSVAVKLGINLTKNELRERYGKEKAEYLHEQLSSLKHYTKTTFIETGVEPDNSFEDFAKTDAQKRNMKFEKIKGDLSLLKKLVNGDWNDDEFLIIKPNQQIAFSYDDNIMKSQ
ncbi:MAG: DUF1638 domain-containing protein [Planctomycetaceae bacterium]|jgi:hypothetical protein|nr:DUF1638 domain-containing protein [Planctomycetaceae bacterium]